MSSPAKIRVPPSQACSLCLRPAPDCFCGKITPQPHSVSIVILQHPQERFKLLNSATLAREFFSDCNLRVGLSWRNLATATQKPFDASEWAVLYLKGKDGESSPVTVRGRDGAVMRNHRFIRGILALDGNWQQAKTLWWRNPWLLKCPTVELHPEHASLRGQVKKGGLSTMEAVGFCLSHLENRPELFDSVQQAYGQWIVDPARRWVAVSGERAK